MWSGSDDGSNRGAEKYRWNNYSLGGGFLRTLREWISGFHDQLRQRPSSLLMLFGCSSISMASLNSRPCIWIWWIGSWCFGVGYNVPGWCCVQLLPICLDEPDECVSGAPWSWYQWNGQSTQCKLDHIRTLCCTCLEFSVPGHLSRAEENQQFSLVEGLQTLCYAWTVYG
jgi:hypothetical protein